MGVNRRKNRLTAIGNCVLLNDRQKKKKDRSGDGIDDQRTGRKFQAKEQDIGETVKKRKIE